MKTYFFGLVALVIFVGGCTVPPVGSGAIIAGTTSGVEPVFAFSYTRKSESLTQKEFKVFHPLVNEFMKKHIIPISYFKMYSLFPTPIGRI
jgi:hypothetical protein